MKTPCLTVTSVVLAALMLTGCSAVAAGSSSMSSSTKSVAGRPTLTPTPTAIPPASSPTAEAWPTRSTGTTPSSWTSTKTGGLGYAVPAGWVLNNPNPVNWHSAINNDNLTVWTAPVFGTPDQKLSVPGASSAAIGVQPAPDGQNLNARVQVQAASGTYSILLVASNDASGKAEISDFVSSLAIN